MISLFSWKNLVKMSVQKAEKKPKEFILWRILKSITIEPAVFMISLSMTIENISNSQIVIDKTCKIDYEYNDTVCDTLVTDFKDENSDIQNDVSTTTLFRNKMFMLNEIV